MDSSEFFTTPTVNNSYRFFKPLSESGFNTLHIAEREGKRFVIKSLSKEFQGNPLYESLLSKEFEISYLLDHQNICRTYSHEEIPEVGNAIVMEWLDGRTLEAYMAEKPHTTKELQRIIGQLCDALSYAHKRQTIHRDIKPQNIIITYNGDNVKLLDFGLSDTDSHTLLKEPAGSRKYASPELMRGTEVDSRSDIYSLGIIIDELYGGQSSSLVKKIVARSTAYYPENRYRDAEAVAAAFVKRPRKLVYPLIFVIFLAVGYLFYASVRVEESVAAKVAGSVTDMVTTTVEGMVVGEVSDRVTNNLTDKVSDNVTTKVTDIVTNNLEGIVSEKVEGRVKDVVTEKVEGMVTEKVTDKVTDKVTEKVTSNVTERVTEYLIPSPEVDGVSEEEFERREALCEEFFKALDAYTVKMQLEISNSTCKDEKLPDFKELKPNYIAECEKLLESMLSSIESSSLYPYARREMKSKTDEYFKITKNSFPVMFWINSEMEYAKAKDSIASELRKIPQPEKAENFSELSSKERKKANIEHSEVTLKVWVVEYRKASNLTPISDELLKHPYEYIGF